MTSLILLKISTSVSLILLLVLNLFPIICFIISTILESKSALRFLLNVCILVFGIALLNFSSLSGLDSKNGYCQIASILGYFIICAGIYLLMQKKKA